MKIFNQYKIGVAVGMLAATFAVAFAQNFPNAPTPATPSANQAQPIVGVVSNSADAVAAQSNNAGTNSYTYMLNSGGTFERWRSLNGGADFSTGLGVGAVSAYAFNGANYERTFSCVSGAVVNVTAGATTQVIAQSSSTAIRICSIVLTISAPGTAAFVQGTGSNCGTGQASLTGPMTMTTGVPISFGSGMGSVLRTSSAQAFCLSATGGNVAGWVMFAQY